MRLAEGYSIIFQPGERDIEHDTCTCGHCGAVSFTKAGLAGPMQVLVMRADGTHYMKDAGFCRKCWRNICPRCTTKECMPFEAKIEKDEKEARGVLII